MQKRALILSSLLAAVRAQQVGTLEPEVHPQMTWQRCTAPGQCTNVNGQVVLDSNWRWVHNIDGYENCYDGNEWVTEHCENPTQCAQNCALEGANYQSTYGVTVSGSSMTIRFVTTNANGRNVGARLYLMEDQDNYEMFHLLNREFTFDVDNSQLECGLNGAVYFISMDQDGGLSRYSGNNAGARYGTGYCDSQCPRDIKFIGGQGNVEGWNPSDSDANGGTGNLGTCCPEMDIWEANRISTAYTPHPCDDDRVTICEGDTCGGTYSAERYAGTCDPDGCDFNAYRQGNRSFYGPGMIVDTNRPITVVTQFLTHDGTDTGRLSEIRRFYVQDGVVIPNSESTIPGVPGNTITEEFCNVQKDVFGDNDVFTEHGDLAGMGYGMEEGMVLALSLWGDHYSRMLWLDSTYPLDADPSAPGVARGTCPTDSGYPDELEAQFPDAQVTYSNIKFGPIGSTFNSDGSNPPTSTSSGTPPPSSSAPGGTVPRWGQCGGRNHNGPTQCQSPYTCTVINEWYHQCL